MKANQAYKADEEAVSPVVGVILMVAITVVLAAVVFVLVNNLGKGTSQKPAIGFHAEQTPTHRLVVDSADQANWQDIKYTLTASGGTGTPTCTLTVSWSGATVGASGAAVDTAATNHAITANDALTVTAGGGATRCNLALTHAPSNQAYGSWDFNY